MNLAMVTRRFPPDSRGGAETVMAALWREARRRSHRVDLWAGFVRDAALLPIEAHGVDLRDAGTPGPLRPLRAALRFAMQVARPLRHSGADVVLSQQIEVPQAGLPTAFIVHDANFGRLEPQRWRERLYAMHLRSMEAVIAVSETTAARWAAAGVDERRITVIENGLDTDHFVPVDRLRAEGVTVLLPSRLVPGKGQDVVLEALRGMPASALKRLDVHLVGAAPDPGWLAHLQRRAAGLPVRFSTDVVDMAPHYQAADLVIFPTQLAEGHGCVAVEAMACARPLIWSDDPAVRAAVGGIGFPIPAGSPRDIRARILDFLHNPEPFDAVGRVGRAWVVDRYSWARSWAKYETVLETIRLKG
jgi:glycosyltransferase involved in cell wall biosynthesis